MNDLKTTATAIALLLTTVSHAQYTPSPTFRDWTEDSKSITAGATSKYGQAEKIYRWLCDNIEYDMSKTIFTADECWNARMGCSQAYCEVFQRLAEPLGLETVIITGDIKNNLNEITPDSHAWMMVKIDDGWILTDPTWGAGSITDGRFVKSDGDMSWFHVDPYIMITSHLPASKGDQLISPSIDRETFSRIDYIDPAFGKLGLNGRQALNSALKDELDLPFIYGAVSEDMLLNRIPLKGTVKTGDILSFESGNSLKYEYEIRIDDKPIPSGSWNVSGSRRTAEFIISGSEKMMIYVLDRNASEGEVAAAFEYEIESGGKSGWEAIEAYDPYLTDELRLAENMNVPFMRQMGIDGHMVLADLRAHAAWAVPVLYKDLEKVRLINVPFHSPLKVGETYTFEFETDGDENFVIINEDIWHRTWDRQAKREGIYKTEITIDKPGFIGIGINVGGKRHRLLIEYEVID